MSSKLSFSICRVCFAPDCVANLSSLFEGNAEKFQNITRIDVRLQIFLSNFKLLISLLYSQISSDQGKHDTMICDRCLNELNLAFEFAERSRSAEKLYFAKRRTEFEAEQQEQQEPEKAEAIGTEYEEGKIKREPSIEIEDVEIDVFEESDEINAYGETEEDNYNNMDADTNEEQTTEMFAIQATADSSSTSLIKVPVSAIEKKKTSRTKQFQCLICNKALLTKQKLQQHIETVHEKKTRFNCPHCSKAFYRKDGLHNHIAQRHTFTNDDTTNSNRPFECDVDNCGMFFKTKNELKKHQRAVHSSEFPL
jgi:Zinc finger, C2H2 type